MAKKYRPKVKMHDAGLMITTNSPYGSHADMVVDPIVFASGGAAATLKGDEVICQDDRGYYTTLKSRLDNGLADPNRYAERRNNDSTISSGV
jgi:hypothetical protein